MAKDTISRVKNTKQFDETFDAMKKAKKDKSTKSEVVKKTDYGYGIRYHYK